MQIFLSQSIMHYLDYTLTMIPSYESKALAQLTVSTFSRKKYLGLPILKSVTLTHRLCPITLKLPKLQIKSWLMLIIIYVLFLLTGFHLHQCLTIIKHHLPLMDSPLVIYPQNNTAWKKRFCQHGYKNLKWYSERNEVCDIEHIFIR